jgi:hypothetical protein
MRFRLDTMSRRTGRTTAQGRATQWRATTQEVSAGPQTKQELAVKRCGLGLLAMAGGQLEIHAAA